MLAPSGSLLRAGIGLKLSQIKIATRSYLRDRTNQATGTMTSYADSCRAVRRGRHFPDRRLPRRHRGAVSLDRNPLRTVLGVRRDRRVTGDDCCDLCRCGRGQIETTVAALSHAHQPASRGDQGQSAPTGPDRSRARYRGLGPAGAFGATAPSSHATIPAGAEQQEYSGRPARDGDAAGLGGHAAAIARAPNGRLMPRARPDG